MTNQKLLNDFLSAQKYVGINLPTENYDCADFFLEVQEKIFNVCWSMPGNLIKHKRGALGQIAQFKQAKNLIFRKIDQPTHGCIVLIIKRDHQRDLWHIGTIFEKDGEFWVLHTSEVMMGAAFNRVYDLARLGQKIEGYYKWK